MKKNKIVKLFNWHWFEAFANSEGLSYHINWKPWSASHAKNQSVQNYFASQTENCFLHIHPSLHTSKLKCTLMKYSPS